MARECRKMVEGGGSFAAYPCELLIDDADTQHPGPCMVKEIPVTMTRRLQWARDNAQADEVERIGRIARGVLGEFQGEGRTAGQAMDGGTTIPDEMNTRITPDEADDERAMVAPGAVATDPPPTAQRMTPGGARKPSGAVAAMPTERRTHMFPSDGSMTMPCCGMSMHDMPMSDAVSRDVAIVTCHGVDDAQEEAIEVIEQWREAEPMGRAPRGSKIDSDLIKLVEYAIAYGRGVVSVDVT